MHTEAFNQFRELSTEADWPFFDPDYALAPEIREHIRPLTEAAAEEIWRHEISQAPLERHVMRLPENHWLKPNQLGPNWLQEWNSDEGSEVFSFLQANFPIPSSEPVFFLLMSELAYQIPIGIMAKHWRVFLALDDEGPLVLHSSSGYYALFGPNGYLRAGQRR